MREWSVQGRQTDQEEGDSEAVEYRLKIRYLATSREVGSNLQAPRQSQNPDGRLHPEQDIPEDRGDKEDGSNDVQVDVCGRVASSQKRQLERGLQSNGCQGCAKSFFEENTHSTQELSNGYNDGV
jgi:hypothetical protein